MNCVIDASVLVKFFIPEILSEKAEELNARVMEGDLRLLAPDLIFAEVGNILWKKHRRKELSRAEAEEIVDAVVSRADGNRNIKSTIALCCGFGVGLRDNGLRRPLCQPGKGP